MKLVSNVHSASSTKFGLKNYKVKKISLNATILQLSTNVLLSWNQSDFLKEVEELKIIGACAQSIPIFLTTIEMPKLHTLFLITKGGFGEKFDTKPIESVRNLTIHRDDPSETSDENLREFLSFFPMVTNLQINLDNSDLIESFDAFNLCSNLRKLSIACKRMSNEENFLFQLTKLPLLTKLYFNQYDQEKYNEKSGKHSKFHSLMESVVRCNAKNVEKYFSD